MSEEAGAGGITWDLDELLSPPGEAGIDAALAEAENRLEGLAAAYRGKIAVLSAVQMHALLSEYEANPVSVMEALALGRRVLVADTSGLSELAREGLARAIPIDASPEQIARALVDLIRSPEPANLSLPTWDESAARLADVYREVLGV